MNDPVKQGDTIALSYTTTPPQNMTTWAVRVLVRDEKDDGSDLIDQTLTEHGNGNLTKIGLLDTTTLAPGEYHVMALLTNAGTGESKEIHDLITVEYSPFAS